MNLISFGGSVPDPTKGPYSAPQTSWLDLRDQLLRKETGEWRERNAKGRDGRGG